MYAIRSYYDTIEVKKTLSASNGATVRKRKQKTEVLTANYKI